MKKKLLLIMLILLTSFSLGCSSEELLSEYFKMDLEQVKSIIEESYEKEEEFTEEEREIVDRFREKYKYGQYHISKDEGYYEMNDLEKAIYNEMITMSTYINEYDLGSNVLASDKEKTSPYMTSKNQLDELMGIKNIKELPKEFKNKYPTYEITSGLYPEQFEEDMKNFIETFDPIINGDEDNVEAEDSKVLEMIFNEYNMAGMDVTGVPNEYKQDNKHYLVNSEMSEGIKAVRIIISDISEGYISEEAVEGFNTFKESMDLFGKN